ncbi:MAG: hypothetical protein LQ352_007372, partial [Teloschistes flavicans]
MAPSKPGQRTSTPLKILMLHGYTQSGPLFRAKTRALEKALTKALPNYSLTLSYPTGPVHLSPSDIPGYDASSTSTTTANPQEQEQEQEPAYGWWRRKDLPVPQNSSSSKAQEGGETETIYTHLPAGLSTIAQTIFDEGPFDGVIGFSQGACAAAMLASLLEPRRQRSFFAVTPDERAQKEPFPEDFISTDPGDAETIQEPLKFAIVYSGFCAPGRR